MPEENNQQTWMVWCVIGLLVLVWLARLKQPAQPPYRPELLHGVWRMTADKHEMIWTFSPDGKFRWQLHSTNAWGRLLGLELDAAGFWRLQGDRLTIEMAETPFPVALLGEHWDGQSITPRIKELTPEKLVLEGVESEFRRSLAPPQ